MSPSSCSRPKVPNFDKVKGLDLGADDYIAKPFGILEFISRVKALLRHAGTTNSTAEEPKIITLGKISLDESMHTVKAGGNNVELTYKEYELLKLLLSHPGLVYSRQQILAKFANKDLRITLIDSKGGILYDSDAEAVKMENHNNREEVIDAFAKGSGEDLRYSSTLQAKAFYFAKRLDDGNVLRLVMRQVNLQQVYSKTIPYLIALLAAIVVAAILIAIGLSRVFISPLQKLIDQLGTPEWQNIENVYKEIDPLVNTIRKQDLELQLTIEQLSNEKQKISHLKDEFTANASHELKAPLTSISGYAELIENGMAKPEDVKVFAGKIHKEAQRLQSIANDIITLSKLNNCENEPFDLSEKINLWNLSHSCIEGLILNANKKSIQLTLDGDQNAEIQGNSKLLFEMIFNLVDNAIRYTEQGGKVVVLVEPKSGSDSHRFQKQIRSYDSSHFKNDRLPCAPHDRHENNERRLAKAYRRTPPRRSRHHDQASRRRTSDGHLRHRRRAILDRNYRDDREFCKCRALDVDAGDSRNHGRKHRNHRYGVDYVDFRFLVQHEQLRVADFRTRHRAFLCAQE